MVSTEKIKRIIQESTPALEKAIYDSPLKAHPDALPEDMQLYNVNCGLGTAALQHYLLDEHDIKTERIITHIDKPRTHNFRRLSHVALRTEHTLIDPTANQFLSFVGLTAERAHEEKKTSLFDPEKVFVFDIADTRARINVFSQQAYTIDRMNLVPLTGTEYGSDGALRGASQTDMDDVYHAIWNLDNYAPYPVTEQDEMRQHHYMLAGQAIRKHMNS